MRVESTPEGLYEQVREGFQLGVDQSTERARRGLGSGPLAQTIHAEPLGPLSAQIGSDHPGVKAQEGGAYIVPKQRRALHFRNGTFSMHARIPAKHFLRGARDAWAVDLRDGLLEVSR